MKIRSRANFVMDDLDGCFSFSITQLYHIDLSWDDRTEDYNNFSCVPVSFAFNNSISRADSPIFFCK